MTEKRDARRPTLSLCMIVKNEEQHLVRCLESVQGVADEIVVVDTGSDDATPEIARSYRAKLLRHEWQEDFALARNLSLDHATGDWILVLDADEELESRTRVRLRTRITATDAEALQLVVRSFTPAGDLQRYEDIYLTRVFRNRPHHRYEQPIHEQIRPSIERCRGKVAETDLIILHYGYAQPTAQGRDRRAGRNLKLLEKAVDASPTDPYLHYQLGATHKALGNRAMARSALCRALELDRRSLGNANLDRLYMKLAQLALASDEFPQAVEYALASLNLNPENGVSRYVLALAHLLRGDVRQAYPHFLHLRRHPGTDLSSTGDLEAVLDHCQSLLKRG